MMLPLTLSPFGAVKEAGLGLYNTSMMALMVWLDEGKASQTSSSISLLVACLLLRPICNGSTDGKWLERGSKNEQGLGA